MSRSRALPAARAAGRAALLLALARLASCSSGSGEARDLDAHPFVLGANHEPDLGPGEALVKGFLRDATTRLPIRDAAVLLRSRGRGLATSQEHALTDVHGRFSVIIPADLYQAVAERCGYRTQTAELDAHGAEPVDLVLFLEPTGEPCPR